MRVQQIRSADGTGTLTYILIDELTGRAAVIDPNKEDTSLIISAVKEQRAVPDFIIDTHTHVDHISGAEDLRKAFGAALVMHENTKNKWRTADLGDNFGIGDILRANAANEIDRYVNDGDTLTVGNSEITVLFTPGHTDNHISLLAGGDLFTGDLLLIGQAGRSDLPGGNPGEQFESFSTKILPLPDTTKIYPGHDYDDNEFSLLGNERRTNPFLQFTTKEEFVSFVKEFFPPVADSADGGKMILQCGTKRVTAVPEAFTEISADELDAMIVKDPTLYLLDVREQKELMMFGHIPNVVNIPSRQVPQRLRELPPTTRPVVVVCQTGGRSYEISHLLMKNGYRHVYNLKSGTMDWVMRGKKVVRFVPAI